MLYHSTTHRDGDDDDAASSFIVESADLGRTTPDGDNDSDTLQTLASPSLHRSTTSCEPRVKSMAAESAFVQDSCSSQNDQFDDAVEDKTTTRKKTINDEVANERQEIDDETREARTVAKTKKTLRTSGSEFARDNAINRGRNDERHSSAEHEATLSVSTEFAVEDRRKLRETKQTNTRTELTRHTNHDEWEEDVTKDVNGLSDQPGTEMISLEKGVFGLGFCIEGGRDCPTGRAPVTVKRLFRGDPVLCLLLQFLYKLIKLSLAIRPWLDTISSSWSGNRHTAQCTSSLSMIWQCKLLFVWGLRRRRSVPS